MTEYHCLISGLPELSFDSIEGSYGLVRFLEDARSSLDPVHLDWVNCLVLAQGHKPLLRYLNGETVADIPTLPYSFEWTFPEKDGFILLPAYVQEFVLRFRKDNEILPSYQWEKLLSEGYYRYLAGKGNPFINSWANFDMNIRNYTTSKTFKEDIPQKKMQVMPGNKFARLLLEFNTDHKEVQVDWPLAAALDKILENPDLLEREKAIDHLIWDEIDRLNLFNYFSIEVVLGYTLKFLIIERWRVILKPDIQLDVSRIIDDKVKGHFTDSPL
ncbi:MAG: DUF2764 family protein [Bacteroidota bacterium]|nr:DUF2764 family protein [Bacteroidota bacterium]